MAVPSSGNPLSMFGIGNEKNQDDYTSDDSEIRDDGGISLRGLSSNSHSDTVGGVVGNINLNANSTNKPDQNAPHSMSEFYDYDHDAAAAFTWATPVGGVAYANALDYDIEYINGSGNTANAGTQIQLTFNSNGSHVHQTKDYRTGSTGTYNTGGSFSTTGTPTIIEARWVIVDGDFTMDGGTADKIQVGYVPGGSIASVYQTVRTGSNGDGTDVDFTDSYRTITPAVFGGSGANTQTFSIQATAQSGTSNGDQAKVATNASGDYIGLQLRANSDNSKVITLRSGSTTNVDISAISYDPPDFTCIMPDMLVWEKTKGTTRIGDISVGDFISAPASLTDRSQGSQWVEVTEARTHTRSGYWDVGGVHITNDHPVWLTDEGGSAWVKVEDMRPGISRTYVAGTVDPVYLGTNPGYYYVYPVDRSGKLIVSGDYAPTTE